MRCSQCVLPDCTPNISFDNDGVCNYCHTYEAFSYKGEDELRKALEPFRGKGKSYDCLVGISGGRDSSYVLLKLVKEYDMKVLAVNYENPFTVPQARTNIENAVRALDVDVVSFKDRNKNHIATFKAAVEAWFQKPSPTLIPIVCLGCKPAWMEIYRIAKDKDVRCIVTGGNPYEVISFKRELVGISRDEEATRAFFKYAYILREILKSRVYLKLPLLKAMMRAYLFGAPFSPCLRLFGHGITWVQLFDYIPWDEEEIVSRITSELNWSPPPNIKSTWRFDCRVKHLVDFMYMTTLNMTDKDDFYAKIVREGRMTRDRALVKLTDENHLYLDEIKILLQQADIADTSFLEAGASR
jgi:hypothetical protein